jgi:hypothetical protein
MSFALETRQHLLAQMLMDELEFELYVASEKNLYKVYYEELEEEYNMSYRGFLCFVESPETGQIYLARIDKLGEQYWSDEIPPASDSQRISTQEVILPINIKAYLVKI